MGFEVNTVGTHCMVCSDRRNQMDNKGNARGLDKSRKVSRMRSKKPLVVKRKIICGSGTRLFATAD